MERLDIYKRKGIFEKERARLAKSSLSNANKALIERFCRDLFARGLCELRATKIAGELRRIGALLNKDFEQITKEDILELLAKLNRENSSDRELKNYYTGKLFHIRGKPFSYNTKRDYLRLIKSFFRWLKGKNTPLVEDLEIRKKESERYTKLGDIITDEEIEKVLEKCPSIRDRAILSLLHETGARAGELLNIRIRDIITTEKITKVRLDGKTGERKSIIINCVPHLMRYVDQHPDRKNPDALLWVTNNPRFKYSPLIYPGFCRLIKEAFNKAGLGHKQCNPHFFRHSRATLNANFLTEPQLCLFFGWKIGSEQVATYVHSSGRDVDKAILEMHGIETKKEKEVVNKPQHCAICKTQNENIADYCRNCGHPLSLKTAIGLGSVIKDETEKAFQLLIDIAKDPKLMAEFQEFRQNYKEGEQNAN